MKTETLTDFEKGPWSYDLYADGLEPVALLNDPNHSQGEWVSIEDYRKMEREMEELLRAARECLLFPNNPATPRLREVITFLHNNPAQPPR